MPTAAKMVTEAKRRIENLTVDETARQLKREDALLVDIREPAERARSGFTEGAVEAAA